MIKKICQKLFRPLLADEVTIVTDGGVCSQMHFYLMGEMLRRRGARVSFDMRWFRKHGIDLDGRFVRNFDLLRCFPYLSQRECRGVKRLLMRKLFRQHHDYFKSTDTDWVNTVAPAYLTGYYHDPQEMYTEVFRQVFHLDPEQILDPQNLDMLRTIRSAGPDAVAVHVRRGDLANFHIGYGNPATARYFTEAVRTICDTAPDARFFIFSDEPDWVRANLMDIFPGGTVVDINGSDRGYMDLTLMAQCHHHITSKGSLGKYAAMLRADEQTDGIVTLCDEPDSHPWLPRFRNPRLIQL